MRSSFRDFVGYPTPILAAAWPWFSCDDPSEYGADPRDVVPTEWRGTRTER